MLNKYLADSADLSEYALMLADTNHDGTVDAQDSLKILGYTVQKITTLGYLVVED